MLRVLLICGILMGGFSVFAGDIAADSVLLIEEDIDQLLKGSAEEDPGFCSSAVFGLTCLMARTLFSETFIINTGVSVPLLAGSSWRFFGWMAPLRI